MRIISQNVLNYDFPVNDDFILRINLAWCDSISELESILEKNKNYKIFVDLPIKRVKPPNNRYSIDDIAPVIHKNDNVAYFAISNVESGDDLNEYLEKLPKNLTLVPKIESPNAVLNIQNIVNKLPNKEKCLMLDHDDLYSNLIKRNESPESFKNYISQLSDFCEKNDIILLRTVGVIFSNEEKRTSQYIK